MIDLIKIPVLMYHEICDFKDQKWLLKHVTKPNLLLRNEFEVQMEYLYQNNYKTIGFSDILHFLDQNRIPGSEKLILLTFDDGYIGNYKYVFPVLKKYHFKATFFVIVGQVGSNLMMDWDALSEMHRNKMSIQSHTYSHKFLGNVNKSELEYELSESKMIIENQLNYPVEFLSLPHGSFNNDLPRLCEKSGFKGCCNSIYGFVTVKSNRYCLPRILIKNNTEFARFVNIVRGDAGVVNKQRALQQVKDKLKYVIGEVNYTKLYRKLYKR